MLLMLFAVQPYKRVRLVSYHHFTAVQFNVVVLEDRAGGLHKGIELVGFRGIDWHHALSDQELLLLADYLDEACVAKQALKHAFGKVGWFAWLSWFAPPTFVLRAGKEGSVVGRIHYGGGSYHFISPVNISSDCVKRAANSLRALSAEVLA